MAKTVKKAGAPAWKQRTRTMHGTTAEHRLMAGKGALIRWNAQKVKVTGEKPGTNSKRGKP